MADKDISLTTPEVGDDQLCRARSAWHAPTISVISAEDAMVGTRAAADGAFSTS